MPTVMKIEELQDIFQEENIHEIIVIARSGSVLRFTPEQNKILKDAIDLGLIAQKNIF